MRILVVEDSPLVRRMYGLAFSRRQHDLVLTENGRAALETLDPAGPGFDLILLDLRMPDMDGVQFLRELHRLGIMTPVIITTAEPEDSPLVAEAHALGAAGLVQKPWKPLELQDLALKVIGGGIA
ncbi:MAG TPA: response regulator [Gemmatimonadales bacterium]|jgi:two-component system chemotaxis response regulator CheB